MCFTPTVSFTIFAIEWILGFIVLAKRRNARTFRRTYSLAALILFVLGFYQFTQYMFCVSGNTSLWGMIGFITYTFLPAIGVDFAYSMIGKKEKVSFYSLPVIFSIIAILTPNFVDIAYCSSYFIVARHSWNPIIAWLYGMYYFGFIVYTLYLYSQESKLKKKNWNIIMAGMIGVLAFTIPTFILMIIFPALNIGFPSILCEFALLLSVFLFYMINLIEKQRNNGRITKKKPK